MEGRVGEGHAVHEVVERHGGVGDGLLGGDSFRGSGVAVAVFADVSCRGLTPLLVDGAICQGGGRRASCR